MISKALCPLVQCLDDLAEDSLDVAHAKHRGHNATLVVVVDQGLGLGVIGRQPLLDRLLVVIRPLVEVRSAGNALSFNLWRIELNVIGGAALAHPSSCDPL